MKAPSDTILCLHVETLVNQEIPAAIARIADETVRLWPDEDPKAIIETVARSITETHWRTAASAAERKSQTINRRVSV